MDLKKRIDEITDKWRAVKSSDSFHNALVFITFIFVATLFWVILSMNDRVTRTFSVELHIQNIPDTVVFIQDPPQSIHVTLSDKGTNLLRSGLMRHPVLDINFRDFSDNGTFRFSHEDLDASLKKTFGSTAIIGAVSLDSLRLSYTTGKGRRVPVVVMADVTASVGNIVSGLPHPMPTWVTVYTLSEQGDTITRALTEPIVKRNLTENTEVSIELQSIKNAKFIPASVKVTIPVEPLVRKEALAQVIAENVPAGIEMLLFPNMVEVAYYVPMSRFNEEKVPVSLTVDYNEKDMTSTNRLALHIRGTEDYVMNPESKQDNVEYTLVK